MGSRIMEFKDYKEKQKFYKERAKQERVVWISSSPTNPRLRKGITKGSTYIKPKEEKK